ncbi:helix-turn-helix domain-containing protein [Ornithinibacillus halophilus]|uniref:HTH cro/C1-type domain-containing protein n=1 Tax=Ornithinibacillus halophilus TaxID=930117 RepID=A0A1M5MWZ9_9BACI|nr:helix-turn-helix transcriptional regulator [Ornithinibacillus halophilus]SHG81870.1 hypothetical protein SAMN05216225_10679 [Ornithinibacillus halophilus]
MEGFLSRVEKFMEIRNLTRKEVSEQLGYSEEQFDQILHDEEWPDIYIVIRLSRLLKVSMDYLLLGKEHFVDNNSEISYEKVEELVFLLEKYNLESFMDMEKWSRIDKEGLISVNNKFYELLSKAEERKNRTQ